MNRIEITYPVSPILDCCKSSLGALLAESDGWWVAPCHEALNREPRRREATEQAHHLVESAEKPATREDVLDTFFTGV